VPTLALDIETITTSEEFTNDVALLTTLIVNAVGLSQYVDDNDPYVYVLAFLLALQRYYVRHLPDTKDIDTTPYLDLLQAEVGEGLPVVTDIPLVEFIREAKSWAGHKGTEGLYRFIGQLVGSPIEIDIPAKKILMFDSLDTLMDGAASDNGILSFDESKLGYIRDGVFYAHFTYVVKVLQAQNIVNFNDLLALLNNVHPSGYQEFLEVDSNYFNEGVESTQAGTWVHNIDTGIIDTQFPGFDNGVYFDSVHTLFDQMGGLGWTDALYIRESRDHAFAFSGRTIVSDSLMHPRISESENAVFTRVTDNINNVIPTTVWASASIGATITVAATVPVSQQPTVTVGGTATPGDVITVTVYEPSLPGGQEVVTYTVESAFNYMADTYAQFINSDSTMQAANITAFANGPVITIMYSTYPTTITTTVNGGATLTSSVGSLITRYSTAEVGGIITPGDVITLTVNDSGLVGGTESVTYTILNGDKLTSVAAGLAAAINGDSNLSGIGVTAVPPIIGSTLTLVSTSANTTTYTESLSMGATESLNITLNTQESQDITLGGTQTFGNTLHIFFSASNISGSPYEITLNVAHVADYLTTDQVTGGLSRAINANGNLIALYNGDDPTGSDESVLTFTYFYDYVVIDPQNRFDATHDLYLYSNQTTNMGFAILKYESIENMPWIDLENIAWDLDGQNPPTTWYYDLPTCTIIQSIAP
jgi:hypothetical protein